jgi:hypothetical protein
LSATASVPGSFAYDPATGVVLNAGYDQYLKAVFTPNDATNYNTVTASVKIFVLTPAQKVQEMVTTVQGLVASGELNKGQDDALNQNRHCTEEFECWKYKGSSK